MEYYIYLTNDCNLHCSYCSALFDCQQKGIPFSPNYSIDELFSFVDETQKRLHDDMAVLIFFGGEPTLEFERMRTIQDMFHGEGLSCTVKFVLHTNGLLLNELPKSVACRLDLVILSWNYDHIPRSNLSDGYFAKIMTNVRSLRQYKNLTVTARLTISENVSLYILALICEHFFDSIYWQIANCHAFSDFNAFYKTYTYETELTFAYWLKELERGNMLPYLPFQSVLREMVCPTPNEEYFCCSYESSQIYLQTDGSLYSCCDNIADSIPAIGSISGGYAFCHPKWTEYAICRECQYNTICRGRCGRMHREFTPEHVSEYCAMNRFMFELFDRNKERLLSAYRTYPSYNKLLHGWKLDIMELTP